MKVIEKKLLALLMFIIVVITVLSIPDDSKMGEIYFKSYKIDEAYEYYKKSDTKANRSIDILQKLKDYYLVQGDLDKSLEMQEEVVEMLPNSKLELKALEDLYRWTGKTYKSLQTQERLAMLEKKTSLRNKKLLEVSFAYRWLRKYSDSERLSRLLVESGETQTIEASLSYFISTGNYEQIIALTDHVDKSAKITKDILVIRAQSFELLGQFERAIKTYTRLLFFERPNLADSLSVPTAAFFSKNLGLYEKIISLLKQMEKTDEVIVLFENILVVKPNEYEITFELSDLYKKVNREEDQKKALLSLYKSKDPSILYRAADAFRLFKDFETSLWFLKKLLRIRPNGLSYYRFISEVYEEYGQLEKALEYKYRMRRVLERKLPKQTSLYLNYWWSSLIAQAQGVVLKSRWKEELRLNHRGIIYLLQKIDDQDKILGELELYNKRYPLDLDMKNLLAGMYIERNEVKKAKNIYSDVLAQNYLDKTASLFFIDDYIANRRFDKAVELIERFPEWKTDPELLNRSFSINEVLDIKKRDQICANSKKIKSTKPLNFALTDLHARCSEIAGRIDKSEGLYLDYLQQNPREFYPKLALGYFYVRNKKMNAAQAVLRDLEKGSKQETVQQLRSFYANTLRLISRRNAYEFTSFYEYFLRLRDKKKYTRFSFKALKNLDNHALGIGVGVQDPIFPSHSIGDSSLLYSYSKDFFTFDLDIGKNYINNNGTTFGANASYRLSSNLFVSSALAYNRQIFDLIVLTDDLGATKDSLNFNLFFTKQRKYESYLSLELSKYYVTKRESSSSFFDGAFQFDFFLEPRFLLGPYFFIHRNVGEGDFPDNVISQKNTVIAIHGRYIHIPESAGNRISSFSDVYLGADLETENPNGAFNYLNLQNKTILRINDDDFFELETQISKQLFIDEDETVFRAKLTYNMWYY